MTKKGTGMTKKGTGMTGKGTFPVLLVNYSGVGAKNLSPIGRKPKKPGL